MKIEQLMHKHADVIIWNDVIKKADICQLNDEFFSLYKNHIHFLHASNFQHFSQEWLKKYHNQFTIFDVNSDFSSFIISDDIKNPVSKFNKINIFFALIVVGVNWSLNDFYNYAFNQNNINSLNEMNENCVVLYKDEDKYDNDFFSHYSQISILFNFLDFSPNDHFKERLNIKVDVHNNCNKIEKRSFNYNIFLNYKKNDYQFKKWWKKLWKKLSPKKPLEKNIIGRGFRERL